ADRGAARLANRLVGNARGAAVLETVLGGLTLRAHRPAVVALTGAAGHLDVVGPAGARRLGAGAPGMVGPGETLAVPPPATGLRSYLAVRGGVDVPQALGSRSSDVLAGLGPAALAAGDVLGVGTAVEAAVADAVALAPPPAGEVTVRAVPGPDPDVGDVERLWDVTWTVSAASDRVGLRLTGGRLGRPDGGDRASSGVVAGAVQVPPSGEPVVFLVDHPVTGGYPVVAVVVDADRDVLAQLRPGQGLRIVPYRGTGPRVDSAPALADPEEVRVETSAGPTQGAP
ncbi:biotin-dependent carboxyltransferase family protein, partial [Actinotalea ferrariae]|uniref:5-oxoprolinase subunit C family protein n=1 Tax=Actinotalea ferrariae TaxID=1386098 RepID=UPI001C8C9093